MDVQHFFDKETSTLTYIVFDSKTRDAVIIDPVMDYDGASGFVENTSVKILLDFINNNQLTPHYVLETHAHADHLSGAQILKVLFPQLKVAIGKNIQIVQKVFKDILNLEDEFISNGSQFDKLIEDEETFSAGSIMIHALSTPGHTPACMSYVIGKNVFTGDALFLEDSGTGRCDFPEGSAKELYHSIYHNLYSLPDDMVIHVGHDYQPNGREVRFKTTIGISKKQNNQINEKTSQEEYIKFRESRDQTLKAPKLLFPSIQVNIRGGHLPPMEKNQKCFLKMPLFKKF